MYDGHVWIYRRLVVFCISFSKFIVGGLTHLKFDRQVDHSKCYPEDDIPFLKGAWSGHVKYLNSRELQPYLWNG